MYLVITIIVILMLLVMSEIIWRWRTVDPEFTRKFVHIFVGSFVAFWPLFLGWKTIIGLSGAFIVAVVVSKYFKIFGAIHSIQRPSWGEVFFALAVGAVAYVTRDGWIYCAALLHMSLADGLAAVIGIKFGKANRYQIFGYTKSITGTATFFVVSLLIFAGYSIGTPADFSYWYIVIAAGATALENGAIHGLDNLLVPMLIAVSLNLLK